MQRDQPTAGNMTGSLLVAHPTLMDANFRRTILYLSHHSADDGAVGLILNRPSGKRIADFGVELPDSPLGRVPVFHGGPVATGELLLANLRWTNFNNVQFQAFGEASDLDQIPPEMHSGLRGFLGYAGWSRGQLESEIAQKAWIVLEPSRDLINPDNTDKQWRELMHSLGPIYKLLAEMPDDPSLN